MKLLPIPLLLAALILGSVGALEDLNGRGTQPQCVLVLQSAKQVTGRFTCTGGQIDAFVHPLLQKTITLQGVNQKVAACKQEGCLITICKDSRTVLKATVTDVFFPVKEGIWDSPPWDSPPWTHSVLCLAGQAVIVLDQPSFQGNNATGVHVQQEATAKILGGHFARNLAPAGELASNGKRSRRRSCYLALRAGAVGAGHRFHRLESWQE